MFSELPEIFGEVLKDHRRAKGWTQMKLAAQANMHLNAVSNLERGKRGPNLHTVMVLARALGVPASELVRDVEKSGKKLWL